MSIAWMSSDLRLATHPQRGWCSLAQRAAEDGWITGVFLDAEEQYPTVQNDSVGSSLTNPSLTSVLCMPKPLKRHLECVFWPMWRVTSFLLLTVYGWRRDEDLTFYRPQAVLSICCFNFAFLLNFRKTDIFAEVCRPPAWPMRFGVPSQISSVSHIGF